MQKKTRNAIYKQNLCVNTLLLNITDLSIYNLYKSC